MARHGASDIVIAADKTSKGGLVVELGKPRFQVTPEMGVGFVVRLAADRAFVVDRDEVKVFELAHGTVIARWNPTPVSCDNMIGGIHVSADARWLAACGELVAAPFTAPITAHDIGDLEGFSSDSKLAILAHESVTLVDLAQNKPVATLPAIPAYERSSSRHPGRRAGRFC